MNCNLCPRNCDVDRSINKGYCGQTDKIKVARASLHMWEEPCISGERGSGTVFFSGCGLRCVFCQNFDIAKGDTGKEITVERLAEIFCELKEKGAHNINLVTGDHFVPEIIRALDIAKANGMDLPIVFNTSSYINKETLKCLENYVDIYLADFKYFDNETAKKYSNAENYLQVAKTAIEEMVSQKGTPVYDDEGMMTKGVIVRHLLMPGHLQESKAIIRYVYEEYGERVVLSIMNQYTPLKQVEKYPEINRKLSPKEYERIISYALSIGIDNAFIQEGETAQESFIPQFDNRGI
ncbi:MAG: radical SAM protein [Clostridia bacterium]|nr:radical SAM protein [Clostridia bacterium]